MEIIILLIGVICWAIAINGIVNGKDAKCDKDCDHCPFPKCDEGSDNK